MKNVVKAEKKINLSSSTTTAKTDNVSKTTDVDFTITESMPAANQYQKLCQPIPPEYIETYTEDGMEFTGYKAQYAINLLNQVFGLGGWYAEFKLEKLENINKAWLAYGTIKIYILQPIDLRYDLDNKVINSINIFLADGIGGAYARRAENALKGAKTSAFKNACRYLGIGNELYLAGHDEDIVAEPKPAEAPVAEAVPNEIKDVVELINKANTPAELEAILPVISKTEGKAVKELLIVKYNEKKISLLEK